MLLGNMVENKHHGVLFSLEHLPRLRGAMKFKTRQKKKIMENNDRFPFCAVSLPIQRFCFRNRNLYDIAPYVYGKLF